MTITKNKKGKTLVYLTPSEKKIIRRYVLFNYDSMKQWILDCGYTVNCDHSTIPAYIMGKYCKPISKHTYVRCLKRLHIPFLDDIDWK